MATTKAKTIPTADPSLTGTGGAIAGMRRRTPP